MNKKLIIAILAVTSLAQAQQSQFDRLLAAHNTAFNKFAPAKNLMRAEEYLVRNGDRVETEYKYYTVNSDEGRVAAASWLAYEPARNALRGTNLVNSLGDGFILGSVLAVANRAKNGSQVNKKWTAFAIATTSMALKYLQNKRLPVTPYFDRAIVQHENFFDPMSFDTFGNSLLVMMGATVGFVGTRHAIERFFQWYNPKPKEEVKQAAKPEEKKPEVAAETAPATTPAVAAK